DVGGALEVQADAARAQREAENTRLALIEAPDLVVAGAVGHAAVVERHPAAQLLRNAPESGILVRELAEDKRLAPLARISSSWARRYSIFALSPDAGAKLHTCLSRVRRARTCVIRIRSPRSRSWRIPSLSRRT